MLCIEWDFRKSHKIGTGENMNSIKCFSLVLGLMFSLNLYSQQKSGDAPNRASIIGINLNGFTDWNSEIPLNDVFKLSRKWVSQENDKKWGTGPEIKTDKDGWITGFSAPQFYVDTPVLTVKKCPLGKYTFLYEGEGKIDFWPAGRLLVLEKSSGRMILDVKAAGFFIKLSGINQQNYLKNIHLLLPGTEETFREQPFRQGFLDMWQPMNTFRFMDWMQTNGSEISKWSERPKMENYTYTLRGTPLELMIDLCNRQKINPWFCMPHLADDDFVRNFAEMVRDRLDPSLHVYIEYSNEVWNGMFQQHKYAEKKAKEIGLGPKERPWEGAAMYYCRRSVQIFKIWEDVFGGRERLVRVIAWQAANDWWTENIILPFEDVAKNCDAYAIAPYVTMCIGPQTKPSVEEVSNWSLDQVFEHIGKRALPESVKWMKAQKKAVEKYGLRLIAYEGGQHLVGVGGGENDAKMSGLFISANRDPRMGEVYKKYYDEWKGVSGDLFCAFSSVCSPSKWGSWGLAEDYDDTPDTAPKLKATLDWIRDNPLESSPPEIKVPENFSVEEGKPLKIEAQVSAGGKTAMKTICGWICDKPDAVRISGMNKPSAEFTFTSKGIFNLTISASDGFSRSEKQVKVEVK